ncbi:ATP-binding cassette domain-containing protein [Mycoplasmopsis verecunda]|uniref:Oligopeptide transport system ATP-binding protein n=1 Tax=Mycoplasmopsis verecunda TaxID=171291 RepID=A0A1T4L709_9BACT|nr:ATP-binding cassette domain-containing protein [Mycoplasmopsis verecunda]WPB54773.1 ATP-binding cassette domain-containing protein [Mycoplasmopsis verecunda]SJZ50489.1 oligopeptide transport system ATP-binding protein [Mycoplasmopsis verecunda]
MSKKTILEVINLKKYFVNKNAVNKAVDNVTFDVKEGEIVGLIGESGSGKTTIGRSLLRLYDDYNGFVRLDGKIISGKRISRKRKKFMHKNIQMIFQDPMASLNGQNTIYSILKEPLIVNGIIKAKHKDIKSDWKKVKSNFRYTFIEHALRFQLKNLEISNKLHEPFIKKWEELSGKISFNAKGNLDDQFNSYFGYLEERTKINSIVINNLYKNTEELIALYEEKQADFRNKKIDFDEVELENAKNKYLHEKKLFWHTQKYYDLKTEYKALKSSYDEDKTNYKDTAKISKTSIKNFLAEVKNEYRMHRNDAYSTTFLDFYFHKLKLYLINYRLYKELKKNYKYLKFLSFEDLLELSDDFKMYSQKFYATKLNINTSTKASIKELKGIVKTQYNFDLSKYINKSRELEKQLKTKYQSSKKEINSLKNKMIIESFRYAPDYYEDRMRAKAELAKAQALFDEESKKYIIGYKERIAHLQEQIIAQSAIETDLQARDKKVFAEFMKNNDNFVKFFKNEIIKPLENSKKNSRAYKKYQQRKIDLKVYQTNVEDRLNGIKSFKIESKYLNKNLYSVYLLMGITIKDRRYRKLGKFGNFLVAIGQPLRMKRISNLYTQSIIYKALEDVGLLKQFAYRYPHEFSGGQRQRIVIARALITEPKIIVADEPIASLDISIQAQVVNLLKDLCKKKNIGMVFIAHDLSMIEYIADRVQIMHLGKIVESGKTEAIYANPIHPYTINLFKAIPKISNANEKFQDVKFELSYLEEQMFPNIAVEQEVEDGIHYVYGTDDQVAKWLRKNE